jgi:hypothetical protein
MCRMLGLTLLLTTATTALDQLCLSRIRRDLTVLTPEYLDPSLHLALEGAACVEETASRQRLDQVARQLRAAGPVASAQAILEHGMEGRRQAALLALAGAGEWASTACMPGGGEIHRRVTADGQVYLLASQPGAPARHAPHAVRDFTEQLWCLPASHPAASGAVLPDEAPLLSNDGAPDSLSLTVALQDLLRRLRGADALAEQVAQLGHAAALPEAPARQPRTDQTPVAA